MKNMLIVYAVLMLLGLTAFGINIKKLAECDFDAPYKCEIIHGAGVLFPPLSVFTVWYKSENK